MRTRSTSEHETECHHEQQPPGHFWFLLFRTTDSPTVKFARQANIALGPSDGNLYIRSVTQGPTERDGKAAEILTHRGLALSSKRVREWCESMSRKLQNPDSWFHKARVAAGFRNASSLAQLIGVPKGNVYQWERGSSEPTPSFRPPKRLLPQLANALNVPVTDLLEKLWREKDEDDCPCGCGGKKSLADTVPEARTLAIVILCAKCGVKRIRKRWKQKNHRKLCPTCASTVEYIDLICKTCGTPKRVKPSYVNARQRRIEKGLSPEKYQCNNCASLERLNANLEKELRDIEVEESGRKKSQVKIRTRKARLELFRKHRYRVYGGKLKTEFSQEAQERGRQKHTENAAAGMKYPQKTKSNLKRHWSGDWLPKGIACGICIVCKKFHPTMNSSDPRYHKICHNQKWERSPEGREFQSLRVTQALERRRAVLAAGISVKTSGAVPTGAPYGESLIQREEKLPLPKRKHGRPKRHSDKDAPW